ncbi:cytochrome P450 [Zopfochytrium polystomum]|nr:cytochrome P450 [Zopfochytrium polystomum]
MTSSPPPTTPLPAAAAVATGTAASGLVVRMLASIVSEGGAGSRPILRLFLRAAASLVVAGAGLVALGELAGFISFELSLRRKIAASSAGTLRIPMFSRGARIKTWFLRTFNIGNEWTQAEPLLKELRRQNILRTYLARSDRWVIHVCGIEYAKIYGKIIEIDHPKAPPAPGIFTSLVGKNIQFTFGDSFLRVKSVLMPVFQGRKWDGDIIPTMTDLLKTTVEQKRLDSKFMLADYVARFAMDCVGQELYGVDFKVQRGDELHLFERLFNMRFFNGNRMEGEAYVAKIHETLFAFVEASQKRLSETQNSEQSLTGADGPKDVPTRMALALRDGVLSEEEVKHNLAEIILAATANVSFLTSIACHHLALQPSLQVRLRKEIVTVLGAATTPTAGHVRQLAGAIDPLIRESSRSISNELFPWPRRMQHDVVVPLDVDTVEAHTPLVLPAGCSVRFNLDGHHRHPAHWGPDAESFRPDRFIDPARGGGIALPAGQFVMFGIGSRQCPGAQMGMAMLRSALIVLLRNYEISIKPQIGFLLAKPHPESILFRLDSLEN